MTGTSNGPPKQLIAVVAHGDRATDSDGIEQARDSHARGGTVDAE